MNYENKSWAYSPFPWLEEKLKDQCLKKINGEEYSQNDFFPDEWKEISQLAQEKGFKISSTSQPYQSTSPNNYYPYYVGGGIIIVSLILVGTLLLKVYKKKSKRK